MLYLVARKSSSEGTFLTKRLIMTIVTCGMLRVNISISDFHIWQHFSSNWITAHRQKLADVPEIPVAELYKHMIGQSEPIIPFEINGHTEEGPSLLGKPLIHLRTYKGTIGMTFILCTDIYYIKRFLCRPATPRHLPYFPVSSWHDIVDDDVEVASIYRIKGMVEKPVSPHENHDQHMEQEAMRLQSHCKQPVLSKTAPQTGSLATKPKSRECN